MAFIVEMWWGRPHELIVQDVDENGELYDREVIPDESPDPERRTVSCHGDNWKAALKLGQAFGWEPKGPLLHRNSQRDASPIREALYEPDGWIRGIHEVDADDARAWGAAIEACVREVDAGRFELPELRSSALIRGGMTLDEYRQANRGMTVQFLRSLAIFLGRGAFRFGWDS